MLQFRNIFIFCLSLLLSIPVYADFVRKINYSGRLTNAEGKPAAGPIDLQLQFFRAATGGNPINGLVVPIYNDVDLVQGVFEISIDLSLSDMNALFDGSAVYIQLIDLTNGKVYPRQEFSVVPYALKVPVDEETISYNTNGELVINSVKSDQIDDGAVTLGKIAACGNADEILKWDGSAWVCAPDEIGASGTGDITSVSSNNGLTGGAATGDVTLGIAANGVTTNRLADAAVETAKIANAAITSDKLANTSVSADKIINAAVGTDKLADGAVTVGKLAACDNADEILKWNGSAWACAADADTNAGGDVTEVTANDGLTGGGASGALTVGIAANGVTTNRLADAAVETAKIADAAITVDKLAACANADEILKWNGSTWACAADSAGSGDVTGITANDGLSGGGANGDLTIGIAANGVTTNRLADAAVETDKLANGAVTLAKIAACDNADEILKWNGSAWTCGTDVDTNSGGDITGVTAGAGLTGTAASGEATLSIVDEGVTTAKIANAAIINDKLANASVSSDKIINAAVGTDKIADAAITVGKLAACANADEILKWNGSAWVCAPDADTNSGGDITGVTANDGLSGGGATGALTVGIAANGVTTNRLANAAVESDKLANGAVTLAKIAACTNAEEILKWNGSAWTCGSDANAGGDITGVTAGTGLSGGGASGSVTLDLNVSGLTAESNVANDDLIPIYDASASAHRKMARSDLVSGLESTSNKGAASGYASLNASSKVVQDPANAQTTAAAGKIPMTGVGTTLDKDWLPAMIGDSGAGGSKGAVPAPASGDAAAGKFLKADGTWTSPSATSFSQNDGQYVATDEVRSRDAGGLKLLEDSGTYGLTVGDNGTLNLSVAPDVTVYSSTSSSVSLPNLSALIHNGANANGSSAILGFTSTNTGGGYSRAYIGSVSNGAYNAHLVFGRRTGDSAYSESMRIDDDGNLGLGTPTPGIDIAGTYDYASGVKVMQIDGSTPRSIIRGSSDAALDLIDAGSAADAKWMQLYNGSGITQFKSMTDAGATAKSILSMNHSTGYVTIPGAAEINGTEIVRFKYGPTDHNQADTPLYLRFIDHKSYGHGHGRGAVKIQFTARTDNNTILNELWYFGWQAQYNSTWTYTMQRLSGTGRVSAFLIKSNSGNSDDGNLQIEWKIGDSSLFEDHIEVTVFELNAGFEERGRNATFDVIGASQVGVPLSQIFPQYIGNFSVSGNLGIGTDQPGYNLDLRHASNGQLHISGTNADSGLYLLSTLDDQFILSAGGTWTGSAWQAKATEAQSIVGNNGVTVFYSNTGLTPENTYTPTERVRIGTSGEIIRDANREGSYVAGGTSVPAGSPFLRIILNPAHTGNRSIFYKVTILQSEPNTTSPNSQHVAIAYLFAKDGGTSTYCAVMAHEYQLNLKIVKSLEDNATGVCEFKTQDMSSVDFGLLSNKNTIKVEAITDQTTGGNGPGLGTVLIYP